MPEAQSGATLWTLGYSGHTPASFLTLLQKERIGLLVDVRELPLSRKPGFSKGALAELLEAAGIEYRNDRELGAPPALRHSAKEHGLGAEFRQGYDAHLDRHGDAVRRIAAEAAQRRLALMCVEADPSECHRGLLAQRLEGLGVQAIHLGPAQGSGSQARLD